LRGKTEGQSNETLRERVFERTTHSVRERERHTRGVKPVEQNLNGASVPIKEREARKNKKGKNGGCKQRGG